VHVTYLTLPGTRLFYEREGTGNPPLVFVHGLACAHDDWRAQREFFRPQRCVVVYDLRGHGASTGDPAQCDVETYGADLGALLHALDLPPAVLVGHSLGCRVVLQAYVDAPERVAGLVLVDGSRLATGDPQLAEQAMRQQIQTVGYAAFMRAFFAAMFLEGSDPAVKERTISRALALPEAIGAALLPRTVRWDAQSLDAALADVAVPMLVIQSTYVNPQRVRVPLEPGASTPWLELILRSVPTPQIDILSGAGHFPMVDSPRAVNQRLDDFVTRLVRPA
jgi:pimeloyl-ACP methyl ester carboxylesterase